MDGSFSHTKVKTLKVDISTESKPYVTFLFHRRFSNLFKQQQKEIIFVGEVA